MNMACGMRREREEMHRGFWWRNLREGDHLEYLGIDVRMILKWILNKLGEKVWMGFIWLRIEASGRLL